MWQTTNQLRGNWAIEDPRILSTKRALFKIFHTLNDFYNFFFLCGFCCEQFAEQFRRPSANDQYLNSNSRGILNRQMHLLKSVITVAAFKATKSGTKLLTVKKKIYKKNEERN